MKIFCDRSEALFQLYCTVHWNTAWKWLQTHSAVLQDHVHCTPLSKVSTCKAHIFDSTWLSCTVSHLLLLHTGSVATDQNIDKQIVLYKMFHFIYTSHLFEYVQNKCNWNKESKKKNHHLLLWSPDTVCEPYKGIHEYD